MTALAIPKVFPRTSLIAAVLVATASLVAVSWAFGLWLVVVGVAAGAITIVLAEQLLERRLAHRAATWALQAPDASSEPAELERVIAADIASIALADSDVLAAATRRAERTVDDPWLRALAVERFDHAERLVASGEVLPVPVPTGLTIRRCVVLGIGVVTACTVGAAITRHHLFLVPLTAALSVTVTAWNERCRRALLPRLLSEEATTPPVSSVFVIPEPATVQAIASLAAGRPGVLPSAARAVRRASRADGLRAEKRLRQAAARCGQQKQRVARTTGVWAIVTVVAVLVAEVLT